MSDLSVLVEPLKREVAVPGMFATLFPDVLDTDLDGALADSFGQSQLDGWFSKMAIDVTDPAHPLVTPDLSTAGMALVVITAGMRFVRAQIRAQAQSATYKSGPVEYATNYSASAMVQDLKDLEARRTQLLALGIALMRPLDIIYDGYYNRQVADFGALYGWGFGFYPYEYPGVLAGMV